MLKECSVCAVPFRDGEKLMFVGEGTYKQIPSKVHFALGAAMEILELFHEECYVYEFGRTD